MKVLIFGILILGVGMGLPAAADDLTFDLEQIRTANGKVYKQIQILDSDGFGLLFRHREGIAKVDYDQLSMNLRMLYEPVEEMPLDSTPIEPDSTETTTFLESLKGKSVEILAKNRIEVPLVRLFPRSSNSCFGYAHHWPVHWPRYQPALRLAIPECRALALEDFLITTGLVPRPPGVRTYRLPYNRADLLY